MEAFSEAVRCIKCGFTQASAKWFLDRVARPVAKESLIRVCRRCGYSWHERCLDDPHVDIGQLARPGSLEKYRALVAHLTEGFQT